MSTAASWSLFSLIHNIKSIDSIKAIRLLSMMSKMANDGLVIRSAQPAGTNESPSYEAWLKNYMDADGDKLDVDDQIILDIESDILDNEAIERRVQALAAQNSHLSSAGFCSECDHLLHHWPALDRIREWDYTIARSLHTEEIEAASRTGCRFCRYLWSQLLYTDVLDAFRKIEARLAVLKHPARSSLTIQNWGGLLGVDETSQLLWMNLPGKEATNCNSNGVQVKFESHIVPIQSRTWDELGNPLGLAKSWLSECNETHETCRGLKKSEWPKRLLSISDDTVKMVETAAWTELPRYTTLSYCWGRVPFKKLTVETYSEFMKGIPLETLPKTFRDAIFTSRSLGLSHIWIDALCIVQHGDEGKDWLGESGRMRSVYGGSHVTLAASAATNVNEGFLTEEPEPSSVQHPMYSGGFIARITTPTYSRLQNFQSQYVYEESVTRSQLAHRAWALQEKLLSPRTIHFGDFGVFWECRSCIKSQFMPDGFECHLRTHLLCPEDEAWDWRDILYNYSKAELTYDSDRLPALSGIASHQHRINGDEYLAGLWRKEMNHMMLWEMNESQGDRARPVWRAPTWSWASVEGACSLRYILKPELITWYAQVADAWTETASRDPFGAVVDGEVQVSCSFLVSAKLHHSGLDLIGSYNSDDVALEDKPYVTINDDSTSKPLPVTLDCTTEGELDCEIDPVYLLPFLGGQSGYGIVADPTDDDEKTKDGDDDDWGGRFSPELDLRGLVLRRVPGNDGAPGHFLRLGSFYLSSMPGFGDISVEEAEKRGLYNDLLRAMQKKGEATARSVCAQVIAPDEQKAEQRYMISIK